MPHHAQHSSAAPVRGNPPKSAIKACEFPYRILIEDVEKAYTSLEDALAARDYVYVARFGRQNPELCGCALLLLGNRVGGERILDNHHVKTARSCLYRAFAAWQNSDNVTARHWIEEGRRLGRDDRFDRLETLVGRSSFQILFYYDYHNKLFVEVFKDLPGFEMIMTPHLDAEGSMPLPLDQPISTLVPKGAALDLVLLDDARLMPLGITDLKAPVALLLHDHESEYDYLDQLLPEVDLTCVGATSEALECGRAFNVKTSISFFPLHMTMPKFNSLNEAFGDPASRTTDLFYSGSIYHDIYRYKKQQVLSLAGLSKNFKIEIMEGYLPAEELWKKMRASRFSLMSSRTCNFVASRAIEAIANGAIHLVEEDNGMPYLFSEYFDCFPAYRRENILTDVAKHFGNYDKILAGFRSQIPQFESEFNSLLPRDAKTRATRFLRHLLFLTHVEDDPKEREARKKKSERTMVYLNEYNHFDPHVGAVEQYIKQIKPPHWLRRAFGVKALAMAQKKPDKEMIGDCENALLEGIAACPSSLALHFVLGLCQWYLDKDEEAEKNFIKVTSGQLHLRPDDPMPFDLGRPNSSFWVHDARIRARCQNISRPLAPVEDVWMSYAWAYRAQSARLKGRLEESVIFAARSLDLFMYNEDVQRIYLRNVFNLAISEPGPWDDCFLEAFEAACYNDYSVLHDFAAPAFHILMTRGKPDEASKLLEKLKLYMSCVDLWKWHSALYPEFYPYIQRYGIPHTAVRSNL